MNEGMPILLDIYKRYNVKSTFFFTGYIAEIFPDIVRMITDDGHEVACHAYSHSTELAFDVLTLNEQIEHLKKAKTILEDVSGQEVISFRAPALRVNEHTVPALEKAGFRIDSSVAPQRFDMFFSFGSMKKMKWLGAPRKPYYTRPGDLSRKGGSGIFEIPVNAYVFPYIGTFMRIFPALTSLIRFFAHSGCALFSHYPVFIIHPNEFINEKFESTQFKARTKNKLSYLLADKLRYKLKLKNLGSAAVPLFEEQVNYFKQKGYKFITLKHYYENLRD